jgi:hypothetical protein
MSNPPKDKTEFWIRFVCSFLFFGFIVALAILRLFASWELSTGIAVWAVVSLAISFYAARVGDEAWGNLLKFFF